MLDFLKALETEGIPVIIRHVAVPGITDGDEHLRKLGQMIGVFTNVKGLEVLPYHTMGIEKYRKLDLPYPLEGIDPMPKEAAAQARKKILDGIRSVRKK